MRSLILVFSMAWASFTASAEPAISWAVVNRFPLIQEADFENIENTWKKARISSMVGFIRARLAAKQDRGPEGLLRTDFLLADPRTVTRPEILFGKRVPVAVQAQLSEANGPCHWSSPQIDIPKTDECAVRFNAPHDTEVVLTVQNNGRSISALVLVKDIVIVAMGDSFASGEGSPDRPAIYPQEILTPPSNNWFLRGVGKDEVIPAVWWDSPCHRSLLSWPVLSALRVALTQEHHTIRLLDVACSGAEFMDGFFVAQERGVIQRDSAQLRKVRDGIQGAARKGAYKAKFLRRSQVNEVRDRLCEPERHVEEIQGVQRLDEILEWRKCTKLRFNPDALLMTGGGNDVLFGPAVKGVLMPNRTVSGLPTSVLGLSLLRYAAEATAPSALGEKADFYVRNGWYRRYVETAVQGALTTPDKAVLVRYPNPVGRQTYRRENKMEVDCWNRKQSDRLATSFMSFGPAARFFAPGLLQPGINWVIELDREEVRTFSESAYPKLQEMQKKEGLPPGMIAVEWEQADEKLFADRLLCSDVPPERMQLEANFFCNDGDCIRKERLSDWKFEAPDRLMVNTTNDALLGLRSWPKTATRADIAVAIGGAIHPTSEAHALAADSAYRGLCGVLAKAYDVCPDTR